MKICVFGAGAIGVVAVGRPTFDLEAASTLVTAAIGAPTFVFLLIRTRSGGGGLP